MANCVCYATTNSAFVLFHLISVADHVLKGWLRLMIQRGVDTLGRLVILKGGQRPVFYFI